MEMGSDGPEEPGIYQLRAVLRGISPLVGRRLLVRSDSSIAQLHEVLQIAFGWEDMHLNRFAIRGREYGISRDGGLMFSADARKIRLCELSLRRLERFTYEYDFGDVWVHDIRNTSAVSNWSASVTGRLSTQYTLQLVGTNGYVEPYNNAYLQPYNGTTDAGGPSGSANDTVFGGTGNDFIGLGNGNNYVERTRPQIRALRPGPA